MYRHLFLEADSGAGKSTLIRKIIAPYINDIGGFTSQRLQNEKNKTIAFRIVPARDLRLAVPFEDTPESIFRIIPENGQSSNYLNVFENEGIRILENAENAKLILLDEIGGVELKNEVFCKRLHELLAGDVPCIGVIKQNHKAAKMSCIAGKTSVTVQYNSQLRDKMINEYNCKILQFERNNLEIEAEVRSFVEKICK